MKTYQEQLKALAEEALDEIKYLIYHKVITKEDVDKKVEEALIDIKLD